MAVYRKMYCYHMLERHQSVFVTDFPTGEHTNTKKVHQEVAEHETSCMSEKHKHNPSVCKQNGRVESPFPLHFKLNQYTLHHTPRSSRYCTPEVKVCVCTQMSTLFTFHTAQPIQYTLIINSHFRPHSFARPEEQQWTHVHNLLNSITIRNFYLLFEICFFFCQGIPGPKGEKV